MNALLDSYIKHGSYLANMVLHKIRNLFFTIIII